MLKRTFRRHPWRLTLPSILVGNIPDCAQHQNHGFDLDVKSTFEPPSEEWSKGNPPWTADLGVMSRDATTLRSSFEQRLRWPEG
ncbi:hypothetical protein ACIOG3_17000 [Yersinia rochesterensis]|uniref:hypothetical protein n=2 Tax=Yersinia TaxID=629 RepID=UPI000AE02EF5|nr:hypothetical protein [Yersinia rochesterensis]